MTGSSSCPRLLPLLACRSPCQLYDAGPRVLPLLVPTSAARTRSIASRAHARDILRRPSLANHLDRCTAFPRSTQSRGKKTKSSFKLDDLPQGLVKAEPLPDVQDDGGPAYPTVVLQARHNMQKFENCILLTRVGGFYELYFEHAEEYGPLLNLKVAQKKTNAGLVPMVSWFIIYYPSYVCCRDTISLIPLVGWFPLLSAGQISQDISARLQLLCSRSRGIPQ